ncbi:MAG TPA: quinolinate synthase NadA [Clostridia bacterium]|nr:quinolinate synthase NadA [Clostridia bacterium]
MIRNIQDEINRIKKEKDVCILAHSYQTRDIIEIADYNGDSYQLSVMAQKAKQKNIIMCGVRFMAETVKVLSPEKSVYLANSVAGCPMAEQMSKEYISGVKKENPGYSVVAYINTTTDLKSVCDVCVTSSSAVKIVKNMDNDKILFIPDINLGRYVAKQVPEKTFKFLQGGCPVHAAVSVEQAKEAKKAHPNALLLVHPECLPEVSEMADFVGSTSQIMDFANKSDNEEFLIGTEVSIAEHLQFDCPDKKFYPLSKDLICADMKATTLMDVYNCVLGKGGDEITIDEKVRLKAKRCIDEMMRLG